VLKANYTLIDMGGCALFNVLHLDEVQVVNGEGYSNPPDDPDEWYNQEVVLPPGAYKIEVFPQLGLGKLCVRGFPRGVIRAELRGVVQEILMIDGFARGRSPGDKPLEMATRGRAPWLKPTVQFALHMDGTDSIMVLLDEDSSTPGMECWRGMQSRIREHRSSESVPEVAPEHRRPKSHWWRGWWHNDRCAAADEDRSPPSGG